MRRIEMTGEKYGRLTVVRYDHVDAHGRACWFCQCECGGTIVASRTSLVDGDIKSCGCLKKEAQLRQAELMRKLRETKPEDDLTGQVFGRLTVIGREARKRWRCRCACGKELTVIRSLLISGNIKSCGCARRGPEASEIVPGQRFGMLVVLRKNYTETSARGYAVFDCRCDCGKEKTFTGKYLKTGAASSCGCQRKRPSDRTLRKFSREHGCSVCADNKSCDMTSCKYEKELTT